MTLAPDDVSLRGRVAVVTGAAVGIGEAVALALARFGADVAVCDRDAVGLAGTVEAIRATGRRGFDAVLDVREREDVEAFLSRVADETGRIDVLVNNAGGTFHAPFAELSAKGQDALVAENFGSVGHCIRAALPFVPDAGGSIVNVTSVEAHRAAPGYAVYAAMKAAVENLTKSLALELGERRIRVNCIAPDAVATPGIGSTLPPTPLPDGGRPDDVAGAAIFLASDLSRFVTGATLHVDGGSFAAGGWRRGADGSFEL